MASIMDNLIKNINPDKFIGPIAVTFFLILIFRSAGVFPVIADEYYYSIYSRKLPYEITKIPNFLFIWVYGFTNVCGNAFLYCGKILNALFFSASLPFVYLTARVYCNKWFSFVVAILAILSPINSYTSYFMPESMYYLSFWIMTWFLLSGNIGGNSKNVVFFGVLLAIMALIKPHAILIMPAIILYLIITKFVEEHKINVNNIIILILSFFTSKFLLGYLIAGRTGITIFGETYGEILNTSFSTKNYIEIFKLFSINLFGNIESVLVLFALPTLIIFTNSLDYIRHGKKNNLEVFTFLIFINLLIMTALFTVTNDTVTRINMRYYDFIFPLLYIAAFKFYTDKFTYKSIYKIIGGILFIISIYAYYTRLFPFTPDFADAPELAGVLQSKYANALQLLGIFALGVWFAWPRFSIKIFLLLYLPLFTFISTIHINNILSYFKTPNQYARAAIFTRTLLSKEDLNQLVVVGSEPGQLYLAALLIDNRRVAMQSIPKSETFKQDNNSLDKKWILLVGDHNFDSKSFDRVNEYGDDFKLLRRANKN